jgi:uncharacterized membrane protein YidH (DUF202 family)
MNLGFINRNTVIATIITLLLFVILILSLVNIGDTDRDCMDKKTDKAITVLTAIVLILLFTFVALNRDYLFYAKCKNPVTPATVTQQIVSTFGKLKF